MELLEARQYVKHALFTLMQADPFRRARTAPLTEPG
jgi:hypothetical protein